MREELSDNDNEKRYTSLDIPSHGRVPKWLEDMSNKVERSNSYIDKNSLLKEISKSNLETNNNIQSSKSKDPTDFKPNKNGSSSVDSAKHGRRAMQSSGTKPKPKLIELTDNMEKYIVPNIDDIDMNEMAQSHKKSLTFEQYYKSLTDNPKRIINQTEYDEHVPLSKLSLSNHTSTSSYLEDELQNYSPSILDKENGRRSRLGSKDGSLFSNDLSIDSGVSMRELSKNFHKHKSVPESKSYMVEDSFDIVNSRTVVSDRSLDTTRNLKKKHPSQKPLNLDNKTSDIEKLLSYTIESKLAKNNISCINSDKSNPVFEEILKNKSQKYSHSRKLTSTPNKKTRHKKFKYKQGSGVLFNKEMKSSDSDTISKQSDSDVHFTKNDNSEDIFIIPELPIGSKLTVDILSTWGDKYYVGLNGIELFGSDGNIINVKQICATDVNILPECDGDLRVVSNLLDGINRTQDDMHLWLAPFDTGKQHLITMEFAQQTELAMLRIWNYNKSRIHSYRGAKYVVITLDGITIFKGEIAQASGSILGSIESFGDTILFTTTESILEKIARNDEAFTTLITTSNSNSVENVDRPLTAASELNERPYTYAFHQKEVDGNNVIEAQRMDLIFVLNWGKLDIIGLTGLEIIGESEESISINSANLTCNYNGMTAKLVDGENITIDSEHMWTVKFTPGKDLILSVIFNDVTYVTGLRIWNYNENIEMTFAGVRIMKIYLDGKILMNPVTNEPSFMLRRAPGNVHYDYVQEIRFTNNENLQQDHREAIYNLSKASTYRDVSFEHPIMPEGFVFQIVVYTTWGDQYYVGLNGIEMYDQNGRIIVLTESNICAYPESVNVLPGVSGDIRTPDKLVDRKNDMSDGSHSWLAPIIPKYLNRIYVVLDQPITVSVIKLWNYVKTPSRGVREFGILVDDLLVYNGILDIANEKSSVKYRSILFTRNADVIRKEMSTLVKHSIDSQGTILTNDEHRMTTGGSLPNVDQSLRPFTSVNQLFRGRTSQSN